MSEIQRSSHGFTIRADPTKKGQKVEVIIIAVQGLGSDLDYTWIHKKGNVLWLRDLLPEIIPTALVATYSYPSDVWQKSKKTTIRQCGEQLLNLLLQFQAKHPHPKTSCPIIFVGHSLGGLVIKQALVMAVFGDTYKDIKEQIAGVIFLGTPHEGAEIAKLAKSLFQPLTIAKFADTGLLESLEMRNPELYHISQDFANEYGALDIVCFYETKARNIKGIFKTRVVDDQSAAILGKKRIYLEADHSGLNKFSGLEDPNFMSVCSELERMIVDTSKRSTRPKPPPEQPQSTQWLVPQISTSIFTGRQELLERMGKLLSPAESDPPKQKRFVISGIGGTGKSEICLKFAEDNRQRFWATFWVDLNTGASAERGFKEIGTACGVPDDSNTLDAVKMWLSNTEKAWLLILDNADDPDMDYSNYIPSGTCGSIILTTRSESCHRLGNMGFEALEQLSPSEAVKLLLRSAEIEDNVSKQGLESAKAIVDELGSHTLAVVHAGAFIQQGNYTLDGYLPYFRRQKQRIMNLRPKQANSTYGNVFATFEVSAHYLQKSETLADKTALDLLGLLAYMDFKNVPLSIIEKACDNALGIIQAWKEYKRQLGPLTEWHLSRLPHILQEISKQTHDATVLSEARSSLKSLSIISVHRETGNMSMHPLVADWARERLQSDERQAAQVATGCILVFAMRTYFDYGPFTVQLQSHAETYVNNFFSCVLPSVPLSMPLVQMLWWLVWLFIHCRSDFEQQLVLKSINDWQEHSNQLETPDATYVHRQVGYTYLRMGDGQNAVEMLESAVKIWEGISSEENLDRLASQHVLARAYLARGDTDQGIELLESVVKIQERVLNKEHSDLLGSKYALAAAYLTRREIDRAIELLELVLKIQERILSEEHTDRLASQHTLAGAYLTRGDTDRGIDLLESVVRIQETILSEEHPDRLVSQHELAGAYLTHGDKDRAIEMFELVVKIRERTLSEEHPDRLGSYNTLARAYFMRGDTDRAIELLEPLVKMHKRILSEEHPDRIGSQHGLAKAYLARGNTDQGIELLESEVRIREKILGEEHPDLLSSKHGLAGAYLVRGDTDRAIELLKSVVKVQERILSEEHPYRLNSQSMLAQAYLERGDIEQSIRLFELVVGIEQRVFKEDNRYRVNSEEWLAYAYTFRGQNRTNKQTRKTGVYQNLVNWLGGTNEESV